jgi:hypothetical protein
MTINTLLLEMIDENQPKVKAEDPKIRKAKDRLLVQILQNLLKDKNKF